jgi:hypothetical protein
MAMWSTIGSILRQAPLILGAADALLLRTRRPPATAADLESIRARLAELEQHQHATAALAKELAEQAKAIADAMQADALRTRQTFILSMIAVALGVAAMAIAVLTR